MHVHWRGLVWLKAHLEAKVLEDSHTIGEFLGHETRGGEHGKASVLELLGLHGEEFFGVRGLEAKGVEADITRGVVDVEKTGLVKGDVLGISPADFGAGLLGSTNTNGQQSPEDRGDLGEVGDGGSSDLGVEEEGRTFNLLADEESDDGKHGNTAMGELGLTVTLEGGFVGLVGESKRIEETHGRKSTRDGVDGESLREKEKFDDREIPLFDGSSCASEPSSTYRKSGGGLLGASGGEGRSRSGDEGGGDGELHGVVWLW